VICGRYHELAVGGSINYKRDFVGTGLHLRGRSRSQLGEAYCIKVLSITPAQQERIRRECSKPNPEGPTSRLGHREREAFFGAGFKLGARLGKLRQTLFSARQFLRDRHAIRHISLIRGFRPRQQFGTS
jgi:hypothetical protein